MSSAEVIEESEPNAWWTTLKHEGVLLSPPVLEDTFPDGPPEIREREIDKLRRNYREFRNNPDQLRNWLDTVFEDLLDHTSGWEKEHLITDEHTYQDIKPNRVLVDEDDDPRLAVWIDDDRVTDDDGEPGRIGIYSGRRTYADLVKLLRNTEIPIGILTNGHQFRVVNATLDRESWTEWDTEAWFEGGEGRDSLQGFYGLLSDEVLASPAEDEEDSLTDKIEESRDRQADLSDVMGTQVRESVEMLLQELDSVLMEVDEETREEILAPLKERDINRQEELRARYQASIRIIMRLVVALYAESRELFPKENPVYYDSYSVEGLFRELREAKIEESEEALEKQYGAWPRLQSLSRLIYHGSPHPDIPMQSYGGRLFRPPSEDGEDDVLAGIEVFEHDEVRITDATILEILENLKIAEFRSGGSRRRGPVDFSELRTEYIGMMYEGLLDYDLREATEDDGAIVFLNIGDEPALPFSVLENLDDDGLENLVDNLKDESSGSFLADEEVSEDDFDEEELEADEEDDTTEEDQEEETPEEIEARIHQWAKRVVEETGVYMPHHNTVRAMDPTIREKYEDKAAKRLVDRIIRPGGTYLVSWEGTRKSTGTFYTSPELAVPTVHRTLEPKVYDETEEGMLVPKPPRKILNLKICDPAMGSGTFPVAAIRYVTEGLKESFEEHIFPEINEGDRIAAPLGEQAKGILNERLLSIRKGEHEDWEQRLELQLKRAVVERCIYGVDINPLAVELGKLSIWIETMDPELPFTFLDHKLRVGNSLIGTWLNELEHYPATAWYRDGGDGRDGKRTLNIREFRNDTLKDQLDNHITNIQYDTQWFDSGPDTSKLVEKARKTFEEIHNSIDESQRERLYRDEFQENSDIQTLRHLMNRWSAIWFWPMGSDSTPILDPDTFYNTVIDDETKPIVDELSNHKKLRFFHWELEFPDVFAGKQGFDAVIGNPPWEIIASETKKFFSRYDPVFNTYSRRKANKRKEEILESSEPIRNSWFRHKEMQKAKSNYFKPGDLWTDRLEDKAPFDLPQPQYQLQGSGKIDTYRTFIERGLNIANNNGRLGMIVKGTFTSDQPSSDIRKELIDNRSVDWIYNFTNREHIFKGVDSRERFSVIISSLSPDDSDIKSRFYCRNLDEWQSSSPDHFRVSPSDIKETSPEEYTFIEPSTPKLGEVFLQIQKSETEVDNLDELSSLGSPSQEVNTTEAGEEFILFNEAEENGAEYREFGFWESDDGTFMLPAIEGRMVGNLDPFQKQWVSGRGRSAIWDDVSWKEKKPGPQFLTTISDVLSRNSVCKGYKVAFMRKGHATNTRTMIASLYRTLPCLDTAYALPVDSLEDGLFLSGVFNSFTMDFQVRTVLGGSTLSWFLIGGMMYPGNIEEPLKDQIMLRAASLNLAAKFWSPEWLYLREKWELTRSPSEYFCVSRENRIDVKAQLNALVAQAYGLKVDQLEEILANDEDRLTGFHRVDDDLPWEERSTYKTIDYYNKLKLDEWSPSKDLKLPANIDITWSDIENTTEKLVVDKDRFLDSMEKKSSDRVWKEQLKRLVDDS